MEKYDSIVTVQQQRADDIELKYTAFKKLPVVRRTSINIQKSLDDLENTWSQFLRTNDEFLQIPNYQETEYYKTNFAYETQKLYKKFRTKIAEFCETAKTAEIHTPSQSTNTKNSKQTEAQSSATNPKSSQSGESASGHSERVQTSTKQNESVSEPQKQNQTEGEIQFIETNDNNHTIETMTGPEFAAEAKKRKLKIKHLKENIQRATDYLGENKTSQFFEQKLKQMEACWQSILDSTDKMMCDEYSQIYEDELSEVQEVYDNMIIRINERNSSRKGMMKLPQVNLKPFDGNYHNWLTFRELFEQMIHRNDNISTIEKFTYLKTTIGGDAAQLIKHISNTEQNYETAWNTITNRYNNDRRLVDTYLKIMMNQPKLKSETSAGLKMLHDTTMECINAMTNLKIDTKQCDFLLNYIIMQKLDRETKRLYEQSLNEPKKIQQFKEMMTFIEERFHTLESVEGERYDNEQQNTKHVFNIIRTTVKCVMCKQQHLIKNCEQFAKLSASEKFKFIKRNNVCINCLNPNHLSKQCKSKHSCFTCQKKHHTLLHNDEWANNKKENVTQVLLTKGEGKGVLLPTAIVKCYDKNGAIVKLRALVDQCSQASVITENGAQRLHAAKKQLEVPITAVGDVIAATTHHYIDLKFIATNSKGLQEVVSAEALVLKKISKKQPNEFIQKDDRWKHIEKLNLADPEYHIPGDIDLLLGGDVWGDIILRGLYKSRRGSPIATNTRLGWILNGKLNQNQQEASIFTIQVDEREPDVMINQQLQQFWEIEEVDESKASSSEETNEYEQFYKLTTTRDDKGRYQVRLPFINQFPNIGRSRNIAIAQLFNLERKFRQDPELKKLYVANMNEYFENGHIERVFTKENEHKTIIDDKEIYTCAYLPHHAVMKTTSSTTKCRVVYNASRTTTNGHTLNESLMAGPTIQDDIVSILLRWRLYKYVITGDVARMYRQIKMQPKDAEYQRIVWRENDNDPIIDYKLTTVTFGTTSAPFAAIRTLHQLADDEGMNHPKAASRAKRDFYVDDLFSGSNTITGAKQLRTQMTDLLDKGGFQIRQWIANNEQILDGVPQCDRGITETIDFSDDNSVKTLGLQWRPGADHFTYKTAALTNFDEIPTKRQFLSITSKIYDPIGWLAPSTILIKILFQQLWIQGVQWDEKIPAQINKSFQQYRDEFGSLEQLKIPRWIQSCKGDRIELHGYCDASNDAYAAVIYARVVDKDNMVHVNLLTSKTRVAPIKSLTVPKLELCAATLLSKLFQKVKGAFEANDIECHAWSDSTITLAWICNNSTKLPAFVEHRVKEIRKSNLDWRYVPTHLNPADCASRGITPNQLISHELWWHGPEFLLGNRENWPENKAASKMTDIHVLSTFTPSPIDLWPLEKYSTFTKLQRVVAYCHRFIENCRSKSKKGGPLTAAECDYATISIVKQVQQETYPEEMESLKKNRTVGGNLAPLNPFMDDNQIIRVNGRLTNGNLPYHQKYPMILPKNHFVTALLIILAHLTTLHGGSTLTFSYLRNKFWIPNGLNTVKRYTKSCHRCTRMNARTLNQQMGALPEARINISRPFTHTGLDFAGPILIRTSCGRGQKTFKGYICIFICFATKAIHLEAVGNLTSTAFIASLRRFCSRRGQIKHLYSDNGTNFCGAFKILKRLEKHEREKYEIDVQQALTSNGIQWHFNPPAAPHFGGLWEAGVKSVKTHLNRMGQTSFTYEEFTTILAQIECCLNSRPLYPLNDDPQNLDVLTPGHFIMGSAPLAPPDEANADFDEPALTRWQIVQQQVHVFWNRWKSEYLHRLQQRPKWMKPRKNMEVGDLVLIKSDNSPPTQWPKGRVILVHPGTDDHVRVVTLKTKNGNMQRPITKLCLLPKLESNTNDATRREPESNSNLTAANTTRDEVQQPHSSTQRPRHNPHTYNLRSTRHINVTLLILIGLIAQIFGLPYEITTFANQPGIHFEQIGSARFITGDWTVIVHYNLTSYHQHHIHNHKNILEMHKLCDTLLREKASCEHVVTQFSERMGEIDIRDSIIRANHHHDRKRRSPFDFIGTIASEAFGVLDQRYAKQYAAELEKLANNDRYVETLLNKQISVIQATNQVIHQNEERTRQGFDTIERNLETIKKIYEKDQLIMLEQKRHQLFVDIALQTILSMTRSETIQNNLIDTILDAHHGRINPIIFSPDQAKEQIALIQKQLSAQSTIPTGIAEFYSVMRVRTRTLDDQILYEIKIPLQSSAEYQIYKIQPIPISQDNFFVSIKPSTDYLIINSQRSLYYPLREIELFRCRKRNEGFFACQQKHPLFKPSSGICECEINLLKQREMSTNCILQRENATAIWSQLTITNKWMFAVNQSMIIDIICDNQLYAQRLEGSGFIQFNKQCLMEHADMIVQSFKTLTTHMNFSFTPTFNLTDVLRSETGKLQLEKLKHAENLELGLLDTQIKELREATFTSTLNTHDVHHYISTYFILIIMITSITTYFIYNQRHRIPRLVPTGPRRENVDST